MKPNHKLPWLFGLLTVLILLAGGTAVGLAARLMVAPHAGKTVEVDTASLPASMEQSVDEVVFYPWNLYDRDHFESNISEATKQGRMEWYAYNLEGIPHILGLSGMVDSLDKGQVRNYSGYWTDCPVTTQSGQPALLDVAFGQDYQDWGMTWVARSTGEPPTRAQKEAAVAAVQEDVCQFFSPQGEESELGILLHDIWTFLYQTPYMNSGPVWYEASGAAGLDSVLSPLARVRDSLTLDPAQSTQQQLEQISTVAQDSEDCSVQLVTTQQQVVLVFTSSQSHADSWNTVGLYYDVGLEQYSGVVINSREGYGY